MLSWVPNVTAFTENAVQFIFRAHIRNEKGQGFFLYQLSIWVMIRGVSWWRVGQSFYYTSVSIVKDTFTQKLGTSLDRGLSGVPSLIEKSPKKNQPHDFLLTLYEHQFSSLWPCEHQFSSLWPCEHQSWIIWPLWPIAVMRIIHDELPCLKLFCMLTTIWQPKRIDLNVNLAHHDWAMISSEHQLLIICDQCDHNHENLAVCTLLQPER